MKWNQWMIGKNIFYTPLQLKFRKGMSKSFYLTASCIVVFFTPLTNAQTSPFVKLTVGGLFANPSQNQIITFDHVYWKRLVSNNHWVSQIYGGISAGARVHLTSLLEKESVYIIMHIPVGMDAFYNADDHDMWNTTLQLNNGLLFRDAFLALITQYKNTVRAIVSAHTHENELRALYQDQTLTNMEVLDVGVPGITPNHYNNPGMQVYLYNDKFQLTEAKTYYTTPAPAPWQTYSFLNDYACPKNSILFSCVSKNILPKLPSWKLQPQPIPGNPYEINYPVRNSNYDPAPYSSWLAILDTIQVVPIV